MPKCSASEDFFGVGRGEIQHTPPSEAQQNAAQIISRVLRIDLPQEFSAKAYWGYISQHMAESKKRSRRQRLTPPRVDPAKQRWRAQREADWEATHISSSVFAQRVLDGESLPPSWVHCSVDEYRRQLRSLGCKSSLEIELEKERARNSGWSGLEGDDW